MMLKRFSAGALLLVLLLLLLVVVWTVHHSKLSFGQGAKAKTDALAHQLLATCHCSSGSRSEE